MTVLHQISAQAKRRLGLSIGPGKQYLLASRLERLKAEEGFADLETFLGALDCGDGQAIDALSRHLTTNHTYFFREKDHFRVLRERLVAPGTRGARIWSAAGSTGEEAYSIAMTLAEAGVSDFLILVSDVNRAVLKHGQRGIYDAQRMEKVPAALTDKYFRRLPTGDFQVAPSLRRVLRFRHLNLTQPWDIDQPMDAIFCRNMFIYFDAEGTRSVLECLVASLKPGGLLFLGMTEGFYLPAGTRRIGPAVYQRLPE